MTPELRAAVRRSTSTLLARATRKFLPPPNIGPEVWAEQYRRMGAAESAFLGRFSFILVPYFRWFLQRFRDPAVRKLVCKKSAQVGWTQSVICNLMGYFAHVERATCVAMFPKEGSARNFDREKFEPMVESTPALTRLMPRKSRTKDQTALFKSYPGGFIKFVGSNSIADVKSTSARRLIVEEPDDCNQNLRGQGDSIKLIEERGKTYRDVKVLIGGTPSVKSVSSIDDEYDQSDRNEWHVPCPDCGEFQALEWEQVRYVSDETAHHPVFGHALPASARYVCAHCGSMWNDAQKNAAIQKGHAVAQGPFRGIVGLAINELYSCMHASRLSALVERYLAAKREYDDGKPEALITFWNAALGRSWEFKGDAPEAAQLEERALDYEPQTVPAGGFVLTLGADIQHNRIAVVIRAWGRGEESWLVLFEELEGNPLDKDDAVWRELDGYVFGKYRHASGASVGVSAASLDSGDGATADQVYDYVRGRRGRGVLLLPTKGSSTYGREIYSRPAPVDLNAANTKAAKKGLAVFQVGTDRAKDLIVDSRLRLSGSGPGRIHYYKSVRSDYFEQLLAEVKIPSRDRRGTKVWTKKRGVRNEALDCEILALHASRALKLHLYREDRWVVIEARVRQSQLFAAPVEEEPVAGVDAPASEAASQEQPAAAATKPIPRVAAPAPRPGNFAKSW
jgi:phage terminase large subunit GpA-like protein